MIVMYIPRRNENTPPHRGYYIVEGLLKAFKKMENCSSWRTYILWYMRLTATYTREIFLKVYCDFLLDKTIYRFTNNVSTHTILTVFNSQCFVQIFTDDEVQMFKSQKQIHTIIFSHT